MLEFDDLSYFRQADVTDDVIQEQPWKTVRDYNDAEMFYSLSTGSRFVPLKKHWMDSSADSSLPCNELFSPCGAPFLARRLSIRMNIVAPPWSIQNS
jgi:hypothetical protein